MSTKSLSHLFLLVSVLLPNIICDNNLQNTITNENSGRLTPTEDNNNDNILISKLIKENMCRKKLNTFVRELCRPYIRAERRQLCENMFALKPMTKTDRKICRKNLSTFAGDSMRRRSISRMIRSCCQESCSVSTLTKYCTSPSLSALKMPFSEDRDAIFGLKLPLFKPPENNGQYV